MVRVCVNVFGVVVVVLQEAQNAKEKTHGYKLDKSHIFAVNMFDDFDRLMNVKEEWEAPQTKPYVPGVCLVFINYVNVTLCFLTGMYLETFTVAVQLFISDILWLIL